MRPTLVYSLLRLALFAATLAVFAAVDALTGKHLGAVLVLVIAALVSGVASYWLLAPYRRAMGESVGTSLGKVRTGFDKAASSEDDLLVDTRPATERTSSQRSGDSAQQ